MTQTTKKTVASTESEVRGAVAELADDVRESAKAGQHAASEALRKFRRSVDEAIPATVRPLRKTVVETAIDFADQLIAAPYELNRSIVRAADRAGVNDRDEADEHRGAGNMTESTDHHSRHGSLTSEQLSADFAALQAGIDQLASLVAGSLGLDELLAQVATFAVHAIPGAEGTGVTLLQTNPEKGRNVVAALGASTPFVAAIDDIQYVTVNEGPSITAALEQRTVRSGSLGGDRRWPRFGPRVGRLGVHSVLSLPLLLPDQVVGAINVYAHDKDVFDEHAAELGELFAKPAAVAVHNAQVLAQAQALSVQLQTALTTRAVIDQAIGVIRARTGRSAQDTFAQLRTISQAEHRKLVDVAQHVIDEAVGRARARRNPPRPEPGHY